MRLYQKIKRKTYEILGDSEGKTGFIYTIDDYFITGLIFLNIVAIILETYEGLYGEYKTYFRAFEVFSVVVFTVEYILRVWIADLTHKAKTGFKARLKYIFSPVGITDLLAIIPFYLPFLVKFDLRELRALRLIRLFRIFKIAHYSHSMRIVGRVLRAKKYELIVTVFATGILLLLSSSLMFNIEHQENPDVFPNIGTSLWWAVATLTTIGYGDIVPQTGWGQFMAAMTALFGIGLVAIPTGIISTGFIEEIQKKGEEDDPDKLVYCPYCGKKLPH